MGIGTLLSAMAGSAVNLALPAISQDLGITLDLTSWIVLTYLLAVTVLLLVFGHFGDVLGHRLVYLAGFALFGVVSMICGLAPNFWVMIVGRSLQGVGAAMVMATGPAILTTTFPTSQRGRALGILATATYIGLTVGPPLGGLLITTLGWRWVFFINLPIMLLVVSLGVAFMPATPKRKSDYFDRGGAFMLSLGLPFTLLAIAEGNRWGWLSAGVISSGVVGVFFLFSFVLYELRQEEPLLRLSLFRSGIFTGATISALFNYIALFMLIILMPFYLIEGLGFSASEAGLLFSIQPLIMALVATPSGWLSDRIGSRGPAVIGLLILAVGLWGLSTVGAQATWLEVVVWLAVMGLGTGIFITPNTSALMGAATRQEQGIAGGVMALARNLGMMIGAAAATAVFMAAGGETGGDWTAGEYSALRVALLLAAALSFLGAVAAAMKGNEEEY
ncbi:MAG: MFS transporter [Alphaproteobacteria bacterium]